MLNMPILDTRPSFVGDVIFSRPTSLLDELRVLEFERVQIVAWNWTLDGLLFAVVCHTW